MQPPAPPDSHASITPQTPDDLFDAVPVGYLDLENAGIIRSANLAAANLLGVDRSLLIGRPFPPFVAEEDRPDFIEFLHSVAQCSVRESCEVTIVTDDAVPLLTRIVGTASSSGEGCNLALIDNSGQKQFEGALLASRSLFCTLAQVAPVGIFRTDPQGEYIYVNERWQEIAGLSYDEALYTGWAQAIHPADREQVISAWYRSAREMLPVTLEYRYQRPDGVVTWVQGQALPDVDASGEIISYVGTITDITERKEMEERLQASEAHLKEAQRLTRLGSWKHDYGRGTLYWSDEMYRIAELEPSGSMVNLDDFLALIHPDDRENRILALKQAHASQAPFAHDYRLLMPDGRCKWLHSRGIATYDREGQPVVMIGTIQDITDRRQAEEALNRTRELRNLIIDAVPAFISYTDSECRYQVVNRQYEELTGMSVKAIWGRHVRDILGETGWSLAAPYIARVLEGEQVSYEIERTDPEGALRNLRVSHTPDHGPEGVVRGYVTLVHDITEQKKTEQTLQSYSRRLIDLEDEVRRKLAAELHDELGPDLTALNFTLTLINNDIKPQPGGHLTELMTDATQLVDGLSGKVRNIIARLQPPVLSAYGVEAALRWYAGQMKRRTGMNVTVVNETTVPRLASERELALFRIAKEALTNAAKYSGAKNIMVRLRGSDNAVRISISDDGAGFVPPAAPQPGGGGWGLTIMRMRTEMLGGSFRLKTAPGRGTAVIIEIPKEGSNAD